MRIGFDARMATHPGIGRYIRCLLPEMVKQGEGYEFVLFGDPDELAKLNLEGHYTVVPWKAPIYSISEQVSYPYDKEELDVMHVPHFNVPLTMKTRTVVTVHDLIYILYPPSLSSPLARYYARFMTASAVRRSARVIAVSENTRQDIAQCFGKEYTDKTKVIYEAADIKLNKVYDSKALAEVRKKYRLSDRIILYVGSVKPHKNIPTLIKVFMRLKEWGAPHQLVMAGRWDKKVDKITAKMDDQLIRYLGEVPPEDLGALYSISETLLNLSFYEGFGLTLLEAMRCGVPVVTSNVSSIPEVVGKAAFTLPPGAVEQIADTVYNVLANKELREGMIREGYKQVAKFSWERAAGETLELYRSVVK